MPARERKYNFDAGFFEGLRRELSTVEGHDRELRADA
jgi:hypothetical protein